MQRREPHFGSRTRDDGAAPSPRPKHRPPRAPRRRRWLGFILRFVLLATLWSGIAIAMVLAWYALRLPNIEEIAAFDRRPSLTFVDAAGQTIGSTGDLHGGVVRLDELPAYLPQLLLATEDRRFYGHFGIDPIGLARAALVNLRAGRVVQGGSTITQQLAKNVFLTHERSLERKIQEFLLAIWLERRFSKDEILTLYLNRVYLGGATYGIEAAAQRYFGKSARQVNMREAAILVGLLKAPARFAPTGDRARALRRAAEVLDNLAEAGLATAATVAAAKAQTIGVPAGTGQPRSARYFVDWLADQVSGFVGFVDRDLVVRTTLDPRLQRAAESAIGETLGRDGEKAEAEQAALVALTPDGAVRAMVGGRDYGASQFNRATSALRQPGSAFKSFVFLAAMERGARPDDLVSDAPVAIGTWRPRNFEGEAGRGDISLRDAFARSVNTAAVRLAQRDGIDGAIAAARRAGILSPLRRDLATALGASEVTLLELTGAHAPFANGGLSVQPYGIVEIRDRGGRLLYRRTGSGAAAIISRGTLSAMNDLLATVVSRGTGRAAALDRPMGGKTGTSQDHRDAWFVGFTADFVAGVWFGNDDSSPMNRVVGGGLPARAWRAFMLEATRGQPPRTVPGAAGEALMRPDPVPAGPAP
jgi:penicillin-binding protein 1A